MNTNAHLEQLGREYGFTLEELRANQRGELHPAQRTRLSRKGRIAFIVLVLLGGLALCGGLAGAIAYRDSLGAVASSTDYNLVQIIRWAGILLASAFFLGAGTSFRRRRARKAALGQGRIDVLEGPMQKIHVSGRGGIQDRHIFRVGHRSFDVSRKLWGLLTQGATYRLHFVGDQLLSFAPVLGDQADRDEYDREQAQFARTQDIKPSRLVE